MYSARKPYLRLKMSISDFFKSKITFMKQLHMKFSEFEKPYLEGEYNQMHLNIPTPDWGPWTSKALFPSSGFPGLPGYEPGKNTFKVSPSTKDRKCSQGGCIIIDWPPYYVEPEKAYKLWIWPGMYTVVSVTVIGPVMFTSDCVGHVVSEIGLCSFFCGGWMQVDDGAENGETIEITFITAEGGSCRYTGEVKAACDPTAIIGYTTLGMQVNEQQTFQALVGGVLATEEGYVWALSGGGSLSVEKGNETVYTAPESNDVTCSQNATITLSCDDVVIDTITIAVNEWDTGEKAYTINNAECVELVLNEYYVCIGGTCTYECCAVPCHKAYKCDGTIHSYSTGGICSDAVNTCPNSPACSGHCAGQPGPSTTDNRTQAMKDGGCCPEELI